jgi:hypothetical protein
VCGSLIGWFLRSIECFWAGMAAGEFINDAAIAAGSYRKQGAVGWLRGRVRPRRGRGLRGRLANTGYPLLQTSVVSLTFATTRGAGARAQARQPPKRGLATWTSGFGRMTATRARRSMSKRRPNRASRPGSRRPSP